MVKKRLRFKDSIGGRAIEKKIALSARQREILNLLSKQEYNSAQIVKKLKNSPSRRMIQLELTELEKLRLIKREGESRSIIWG